MHATTEQRKPRLSTTGRIVLSAMVIGYLLGLGGCVGGILLFPGKNQAPLLSLPFGGIGIAVGLAMGIVWSAFSKREHSLRTEFWWLGSFWALTLLASFKLDCKIVFVALQVLPLLLSLLIMANQRLRPNIPAVVYRCRFVYLATALLFLITSLFPPVTHNKLMPVERRPVYTDSNPMPQFLFCNSPRLDASRCYAELGIAGNQLLMEWGVIIIGTGLLSVWFGTNRKKK